MEVAYKIVRVYMNAGINKRVMKRGLTLEQAQAHCKCEETSSSTCMRPVNVARTKRLGAWMDTYEEE